MPTRLVLADLLESADPAEIVRDELSCSSFTGEEVPRTPPPWPLALQQRGFSMAGC